VVSIFTGTRGYLDGMPVERVGAFESGLLGEMRSRSPEILAAIRDQREIKPETEKQLVAFIEAFVKTFE
jgi:F-type H+-transporting ATPase subunit alpha